MRGTVHGTEGGVYRVHLESGMVLDASLRGRLKRESRTGDRVVIGDSVTLGVSDGGSATIEEVHPRRSEIIRRGPGGRRPKVVAANVERLVVVAAVARPVPRQFLLDRLLVIGEANRLESALVLNKMDLLTDLQRGDGIEDAERQPRVHDDRTLVLELMELYRGIGYPVLETSVVSGQGLDALTDLLCSGSSALVGPSGVGKSSLLNAIEPGLGLRTGELSHRKARGRHTTVSARLIPLECGGVVADTPGFSDVGVWGVDQREIEGCFPEFHPHREECQFRGCSHLHEPACGVRDALARGAIHPGRFRSYEALAQEAGGS
jgi:ribosome biogenesis GTPase